MEIREQLIPGSTYHVCTRSNGNDLLFRESEDFVYFKESLFQRMNEMWEIISWVLVPTELHLVIRIKDFETEKPVSHAHLFGHVLNGYVQHYNRRYHRQGSLLNRSFRRQLIKTDDELRDIICKVDNLPVAQDLVEDKLEWKYSSYCEFNKAAFISSAAKKVVEKFGDVVSFINYHLNSGLLRANILPPRKWMNRWFYSKQNVTEAGSDAPSG